MVSLRAFLAMTPGMTACPALASASAVRGMFPTLLLSPKAFVPAVGIVTGPVAVVGSGAGREAGVIALVIGVAAGSAGGVIEGRLVKALVPAFSPCGGAGGLDAREGRTEAPVSD